MVEDYDLYDAEADIPDDVFVQVRKVGALWRVVDSTTGEVSLNSNSKPLDGGGHRNVSKAKRQIGHVNKAVAKIKKKERQF